MPSVFFLAPQKSINIDLMLLWTGYAFILFFLVILATNVALSWVISINSDSSLFMMLVISSLQTAMWCCCSAISIQILQQCFSYSKFSPKCYKHKNIMNHLPIHMDSFMHLVLFSSSSRILINKCFPIKNNLYHKKFCSCL